MKETKKTTTNRNVYHRLHLSELYPIYWDEGVNWYPKQMSWRASTWHCGTVRRRKGRKKGLYSYQYRMYKTWKHNRKTQWREK